MKETVLCKCDDCEKKPEELRIHLKKYRKKNRNKKDETKIS